MFQGYAGSGNDEKSITVPSGCLKYVKFEAFDKFAIQRYSFLIYIKNQRDAPWQYVY